VGFNDATSNYSIPTGYGLFYCGVGASGLTITLPTPSACANGALITVVNYGAYTTTISGTIGNQGSTSFVLYAVNDYVTFINNQSQWCVMATSGSQTSATGSGNAGCTTAGSWVPGNTGSPTLTLAPGVYNLDATVTVKTGSSTTNYIYIALGYQNSNFYSQDASFHNTSAATGIEVTLQLTARHVVVSSTVTLNIYYIVANGSDGTVINGSYTTIYATRIA
jgi:hypothetical protein